METSTPKLILVPADFSGPSAHALRYAAALAVRFDAHLLVVYADLFSPPVDLTMSGPGAFDMTVETLVEVAREQLQTFAETNINPTVPYNVRVMIGTPVEAIVTEARECGANLIVMGTHGRTGLRRLLFGSVTEAVVRVARVPVLAVHDATPETAPMQLIIGDRSTPEGRAAVEYAGLIADIDDAQFVEAREPDLIETARRQNADLIALGIGRDHRNQEGVLQHTNCAVLTVNALTAKAMDVDARVPVRVRR